MATQVLVDFQRSHSAVAAEPLRICHIISGDLWAGAETQIASTIAYLVEQPGVRVTALLLNDGRLADELRRLDVPVVVLDETRTSMLGIVIGMTRILRAHPCDLVHVHKYKDGVLGTIAARFAGVPYVVRTMHGQSEPLRGWLRAKSAIYETVDRVTLQWMGDLVIAVSKRLAQALSESGYQPTMVTCIQNGLDLRHVAPSRTRAEVLHELGLDPDALLVGTVGRLSAVKGHLHLLRAAKQLSLVEPRARFLFIGDGPLREELRLTAAELGIVGSCLFTGARRDVYDLVSAMDVFVLPSLNEGMPMSLLEAMALGRPVVASAAGGIPEVVSHRVNGLLAPPGDEPALAAACAELLRNRDLAMALGARARKTVEEGFSHNRSGALLLNAYETITSSRRGAVA